MTTHPALRRDISDVEYRVLAVLEHLQYTTASLIATSTRKHTTTVKKALISLSDKGLAVAREDGYWTPAD